MLKIPKAQLIRKVVELIATAVLLVIPIRLYRWWGPPTKRGFFCDDESLMYPYREDTVTTKMLYLLGAGIPVSIVIICELLQTFLGPQKHRFWRFLLKCHENIIPYIFAMAAEHLISTVAKFTIGRLRPHFFEVCQPVRQDNTTCSDPKNYNIYIEDYICNPTPNVSRFMRINVHLSFPSGHSSLIFCGMIFTVLYLQRFSKKLHQYKWNFDLLLPLLQLLCVILATFVAVSRVKDFKHHWSDVLAGMLLGSLIAIAISFYVQEQQIRVEQSLEDDDDGSDTLTPVTSQTMSFVTSTPNSSSVLVP